MDLNSKIIKKIKKPVFYFAQMKCKNFIKNMDGENWLKKNIN